MLYAQNARLNYILHLINFKIYNCHKMSMLRVYFNSCYHNKLLKINYNLRKKHCTKILFSFSWNVRKSLLYIFKWINRLRIYSILIQFPHFIRAQAHNRLVADLDSNSMEVVETQSFATEVTTALEKLKEKDVRIILGNFNETWARRIFCEAHKYKKRLINKNSSILRSHHKDFTSFHLIPFQIRYVREKISMGDHGHLHGGMVAPSWRGMQFLRFGGGIARRYIDRLVANHNGEEEDYSWDSELERLVRNLVVSL